MPGRKILHEQTKLKNEDGDKDILIQNTVWIKKIYCIQETIIINRRDFDYQRFVV